VVDDDPKALKIMEATLKNLGYRSVGKLDGASGLRVVEEERPAAVVLDLMMPGMDGFEFLDRLRRTALGRRTPVIVWTIKELTEEDRLRLRAMAEGVVMKSEGGVASLLAELQRYLGEPAAPARPAPSGGG
jgi:CheY-like chemotaxis protein